MPNKKNDVMTLSKSIASRSSEDDEVLTETLEDFDSPRYNMSNEESTRARIMSEPVLIPPRKVLKHSNSLTKLITSMSPLKSPLKKKLSDKTSPSSPSKKEISANLCQRKLAITSEMPESPTLLMKNYRYEDVLNFEIPIENKE
eukprot:gene9580-1782_t